MRDLLTHMRELFKRNKFTLVLFEVAYRTASFLIALALLHRGLEVGLHVTGFGYLTVENYPDFILHPVTLLCGLVLLLYLLLVNLFEVSCLMACYECTRMKQRIFIGDMVVLGLKRMWRIIRRNPVSWFLLLLVSFPFFNVQFLIMEVSYFKVLSYTMQQIYKWIPYPVLLFAAGAGILCLSYITMFSIPYAFLKGEKVRNSFSNGIRLCRDGKMRNILGAFGVQAVSAGILFSLYAVAAVIAVVYAMFTKSAEMLIPSVLVYSDWITMILGVAAGGLGTVGGTAYIHSVYTMRADRSPAYEQVSITGRYPGFRKKWQMRMASVVLLVIMSLEAVYVLYLVNARTDMSENLFTGTQITAHRGGAKLAPENTLSALAHAKETMADYAEIDVHETKDGVVVLLHDDNLRRTTGVNKNIWDITWFELRQLDAGKRFDPTFAGERVPSLQQAIDFCGNDLKLNIEVKYNGKNEDIVKKVVKIIENNAIVDTVILSSMNYNFLKEAKELNPDIRTSYVMSMTYGDFDELTDADYVSIRAGYMNKELVEAAHKQGKIVHAWTVNSKYGMQRMRYYGIDNLITDDPVLAREIFYGKSQGDTGFWELLRYIDLVSITP